MNQARRLWVLTSEYEPHIIGGLGTAATNLTKAYAQSGVQTTVLSMGGHAGLELAGTPGLRIIRFPLASAYYSSKSKQYKPSAIRKWLEQQRFPKPDVIHIHSLQFADLARYCKIRQGIPVVYTCHSLVASEPGSKSRKRRALRHQVQLLKTANRIVVPSRSELVMLKRLYPFCAGKAVVIHHGITLRTSVAYGPRHHLLFVGRLIPLKGIEQLLRAVALLKRRGKKVKLDLVGTGPQGYVKYLKTLAKKLGISSEVRWVGYCKQGQVQQMYASHGVLVMPSRRESFGLVALEALASGIPLVSTRAGGLAEFVSSKVAQTIPKAEGAIIAKAIQSLWSHKLVTEKRVSAGRKLASRFQWSHAAIRYEKLFRQL